MSFKQLFSFPLQLIITGRTQSGKSYLVRKRIIPNIVNQYNAIFVYSPSVNIDEGWKIVKRKYPGKVSLISDINNKDITFFIDEIRKRKEKGKSNKYLFIFDDITTFLSPSNSSYFALLATRGRHLNISYIITTHKYKALNPLLRSNAQYQIFFKITTNLEMASITDEVATVDNPPHVIKKLLESCTGSHNALLIKKGGEDDSYFCLQSSGTIKQVFSIYELIEEFNDESEDGEKFSRSDYKILQQVMKNEKVMFV